jgi:hypothetical protein
VDNTGLFFINFDAVLLALNSFNGLLVWLDGADPYGTGTAPNINTIINT